MNNCSKLNGNGSERSSREVSAHAAAAVIISQGQTDCLIFGNIMTITLFQKSLALTPSIL